jgi:hypothetical protein
VTMIEISQSTHILFPRPTCQFSLLALDLRPSIQNSGWRRCNAVSGPCHYYRIPNGIRCRFRSRSRGRSLALLGVVHVLAGEAITSEILYSTLGESDQLDRRSLGGGGPGESTLQDRFLDLKTDQNRFLLIASGDKYIPLLFRHR